MFNEMKQYKSVVYPPMELLGKHQYKIKYQILCGKAEHLINLFTLVMPPLVATRLK
jgi:hypothetical protein